MGGQTISLRRASSDPWRRKYREAIFWASVTAVRLRFGEIGRAERPSVGDVTVEVVTSDEIVIGFVCRGPVGVDGILGRSLLMLGLRGVDRPGREASPM